MWETLLVIVIVIGAVLLAGRSLFRSLTGRDEGCHCAGGTSCPLEKPESRSRFVQVKKGDDGS